MGAADDTGGTPMGELDVAPAVSTPLLPLPSPPPPQQQQQTQTHSAVPLAEQCMVIAANQVCMLMLMQLHVRAAADV